MQPLDPDHDPLADSFPADDGVLLEARADPTPLLVSLGAVLVSIAALVLSVIAIVD